MVGDTKPVSDTKCCSKCRESKPLDRIVKNRNVCKDCCNKRRKEKAKTVVIDPETIHTCNTCSESKPLSNFVKGRNICNDCNNKRRTEKYNSNEEIRKKAIIQATEFKQKKAAERQKKKLEEIGEGNKKCRLCSEIKPKESFRHNRMKCKTCLRDEPVEKLKRAVRGRIWYALQSKTMHTIKYLGCNYNIYLNWLLSYNENYTLENRGKVWHIDHVIPLSRFNLEDEEEQLIAFNWRNTMPLLARENLTKNARIDKQQIEQHLIHLQKYHKERNIEFPQIYNDLFAKHLVDGKPLKQSLPLQVGNSLEELG